MAYVKQIWECGDVVTADKLNHMEDGIAEGGGGSEPLIVHPVTMTAEEMTQAGLTGVAVGNAVRLDTPTTTLEQAMLSGRTVLVVYESGSDSQTLMLLGLGSDVSFNQGIVGGETWYSPISYPYLTFVYNGGQSL